MLAIKGYFDGTVIKLLENFEAKPNQWEEKIAREKAVKAFFALREEAKNNGLQGMSLDEINEEINLAREEVF